MRVLSIGSINADVVARVDRHARIPGITFATETLRTSGGKAANVAVIATRLGIDAVLIGCVGDDDLADQALHGPRAAGVDVSLVRTRSTTTGLSLVTVLPDGDKAITLPLGANDAWAETADAVACDVRAVVGDAIVVVDLECSVAIVEAAVGVAAGAGRPIVLDPSPADRVTADLLRHVTCITPNHEEAAAIIGRDADTPPRARDAGAELLSRGVEIAMVKLPGGGCVVTTADDAALVTPPVVDPIDATGAGDAFAGAVACALLAGEQPIVAGIHGVAASTCAVTGFGSQESYPDRARLESVIPRVRVETM